MKCCPLVEIYVLVSHTLIDGMGCRILIVSGSRKSILRIPLAWCWPALPIPKERIGLKMALNDRASTLP